ncbi:MAG: ABC transporter permease [Ignavibacteria bacterium]|nr:ABC transporter permease [Ignavibacteria bacterium]
MKIVLRIILKEFQQFRRDPKMFGIILVAPVMQLIFLGYAATLDIKSVKTIVYDTDRSEMSRKLVREFEGSTYFIVNDYLYNYDAVYKKMDEGNTIAAIIIPKDFEKDINRGESATIQAIFNGSDGNTASIAAGYVSKVIGKFAGNVAGDKLKLRGITRLPSGEVTSQYRIWYNPAVESRYFMVPSIVGLLLSLITLLLTSLAIVKEKEIGTLEQLIVTPIKSWQLIAGKLIPFVMLGFVTVVLVLTAMRVIFGIEVKGDVVFLFFSAFIYILSTLGLGLLVSTFSKTQQQAMMVATFGVMMPLIFLSGFSFPVENMPDIFQKISIIIPLKYFILIIRGVILKGSGFAEHWQDVLAMFIIGTVILGISILRFKKRIS